MKNLFCRCNLIYVVVHQRIIAHANGLLLYNSTYADESSPEKWIQVVHIDYLA